MQSQKDELERMRRDLRFAEERAKDALSSKSSETSGLLNKYNRQLNDLEESLRVRPDCYCTYLTPQLCLTLFFELAKTRAH